MDSVRIARIRKSLYELGATLEELYALGRTLNLQTGYKLAVLTWDLDQGIAAVIDQIDEAEAVDLLDQLLEALKTLKSKPAAPPIALRRCGAVTAPARFPPRHRQWGIHCRNR